MHPRRLLPVVLLSAALPASAQGVYLLSDNNVRSASAAAYPSPAQATNRINTGATYTYLTADSSVTGPGNTDANFSANDAGFTKLLDGYSERVGGNSSVYSGWTSQYGATILFDLKSTYTIDHVSVSIREYTNAGLGTFEVSVSTDGVGFSSLGTWDGQKTALDASESDAGRNTEVSISASGLVTARYVKIYLSHWNPDHTSRLYNQLAVGEVAIWGAVPSPIPEPSGFAAIAGLSLLGFAATRRRRASR